MNDDEKPIGIKRGRGRPSLPPDIRAKHRKESKRKSASANPEKSTERVNRHREKFSRITISILKDARHLIDSICEESQTSISDIFIAAVEEKYDIILTKKDF